MKCNGRDDCGDGSDEGTVCESQESATNAVAVIVVLLCLGGVAICICVVCGWAIHLSIRHYILHKARVRAVRHRMQPVSHPAPTTSDQFHVPSHMEEKQFTSIALPTNPELYNVEAPPAYTETQFATSDPSLPPAGYDMSGQQSSVDFQLQHTGIPGNCDNESCGGVGCNDVGDGGGSCGGGSCGGGDD